MQNPLVVHHALLELLPMYLKELPNVTCVLLATLQEVNLFHALHVNQVCTKFKFLHTF
jgi:hypothetical protein